MKFLERKETILKHVLKKLASFIVALWLISVLTFILAKLTSTDPAENYLRVSKIAITPEALENARQYLGLDKPWIEQYLTWASRAIQGDFGQSYVWKTPVLSLFLERVGATTTLGFVSFLWILVFSLPLGVISGLRKGSLLDKVIQLLTFSSVSIPSFWLGYLLMILFGVYLKWLPVSGSQGVGSIILPSLTLSLSLIGQYTALIRKAVIQELDSKHVINARLRGVNDFYLVSNHILPNILPTIVTGLSLTAVYLLTGSLVVEEVFAWNGLGRLFVQSLQTVDMPVIQASMLFFGIIFLTNNVITKYLTRICDPRLRLVERSKHV